MALDPPTRLIDPADGSVLLRLVPFYLARLHGPDHPEVGIPDHRPLGLPFPFLRDAEPIDVVLRQGMTAAAVGRYGGGFEANSALGGTCWWRWASYALTPFGWVTFPVAIFNDGALTGIKLERQGRTPDENFEAMLRWLRHELGAGTGGGPRTAAAWVFDWGTAELAFEPRDRQARLTIAWGASRTIPSP